MATTAYGTNHNLAVKLWSKKLFVESLNATWIQKFIGEGSNSLVQLKTETEKSEGDRIRIGLRMQLQGDGIQGDGTLEGNEEALSTYNDDIVIDQLRHAVRSSGKMSEQRIPFSVREEAKNGLRDWWADRIDSSFFNQISGNTGQADTRRTGNQATAAPTSTHLIAGGGDDTEASLSAVVASALSLDDIDRAVAKAKTFGTLNGGTGTPIRPVMVDGGEHYVLFIHPFQTQQLRKATGTTDWATIQQAALSGSAASNSPIFTGSLGMHNNVVIHESTRVPIITGTPNSGAAANFRRAIFCGAQSAAIAHGQGGSDNKMTWVEELFDYGNQIGVSAGMIYGLKKLQFNSTDFSTICISGYAPSA
tara:strand:- start:6640 stop:7728 length:1089 start_codon:yes stop_codon:yes gene_type:complete